MLPLDLVRDRFPFQFRGRELMLNALELFFKFRDDVIHRLGDLLPTFVRSPATDADVPIQDLPGGTVSSVVSQYGGLPHLAALTIDDELLGRWQIELAKTDVAQLLPS